MKYTNENITLEATHEYVTLTDVATGVNLTYTHTEWGEIVEKLVHYWSENVTELSTVEDLPF